MKRLNILILLLCCALFTFAQSLERQVIANAGLAVQNSSAGLSYTLGQEATASNITSTVKLTQGFQQVDPEEFLGVLDLNKINGQAMVFPNPTVNLLKVESNLLEHGINILNYQIMDLHGKIVLNSKVAAVGGQIDVSALAASTYTILLSSKDRTFQQRVRFIKI